MGRIRCILLCSLLLSCPQAIHANENTAKRENSYSESESHIAVGVGKDPHAFQTSAEMLQVQEAKPYDSIAGQLIKEIGKAIAAGQILEQQDVWQAAGGLNPYRFEPAILDNAGVWADGFVGNIRGHRGESASVEMLHGGNELYKVKRFWDASQKYLEILVGEPHHFDARNNLALAQLHLGNDIRALLELEILQRLNPEYAQAKVNLTVVHERFNRSIEARVYARRAYDAALSLPAAIFNLAWYESMHDNCLRSSELLSPLLATSSDPKYVDLYRICLPSAALPSATLPQPDNAPGMKQRRNEIDDRKGFRSPLTTVFFIGTFAGLTIAAMRISRAIGRKTDSPGLAFITCMLLSTVIFAYFWASPSAGWWLFAGFFGFLCSMLSHSLRAE